MCDADRITTHKKTLHTWFNPLYDPQEIGSFGTEGLAVDDSSNTEFVTVEVYKETGTICSKCRRETCKE